MAPGIMTTTSTCIQLDGLNDKPNYLEHTRRQDETDPRGHLFLQNQALNGNSAHLQNVSQENESMNQLASQANYQPDEDQTSRELKQSALLLKGFREEYTLVTDHDVPSITHKGEILIKVSAIGLNPIDWKAP